MMPLDATTTGGSHTFVTPDRSAGEAVDQTVAISSTTRTLLPSYYDGGRLIAVGPHTHDDAFKSVEACFVAVELPFVVFQHRTQVLDLALQLFILPRQPDDLV